MKRSRIQEGGAHAQGVWCVLEARPYFRNTKTKRDAPPLYRREQPRDVNKNTTIFISKNIYKTTTFPFTCNSAQRRSLVRSTELGAQGRSEFQAYLFPHLKCNLCAPERSCPAKRSCQTKTDTWNRMEWSISPRNTPVAVYRSPERMWVATTNTCSARSAHVNMAGTCLPLPCWKPSDIPTRVHYSHSSRLTASGQSS